MSKLTRMIKELTGEDAVDIFGGDAENIVEELNEMMTEEEERKKEIEIKKVRENN